MAQQAIPPSGYRAYMESPEWVARKAWWRSHRSSNQRRCRACGDHLYDLHHRRYVRLGCERLRDLVPLCRRHHNALHSLQHRYAWTVERASWCFLAAARFRRMLRGGLIAVAAVTAVTYLVIR